MKKILKITKYIIMIFLIIALGLGAYISVYFLQDKIDFPENRICTKNDIITTEQMQNKFKWHEFVLAFKTKGWGLAGNDIYIYLDKGLTKNKIMLNKDIELKPYTEEQTIIILNRQIVPQINCSDLDKAVVVHFLPTKIEVINYISKYRIYFNREK
jgi:uncharacterized membrane protein